MYCQLQYSNKLLTHFCSFRIYCTTNNTHTCIKAYSTNQRQGKCVLRVCVAFACKRAALLSTACERVFALIFSHVFYHTSTYL